MILKMSRTVRYYKYSTKCHFCQVDLLIYHIFIVKYFSQSTLSPSEQNTVRAGKRMINSFHVTGKYATNMLLCCLAEERNILIPLSRSYKNLLASM